MADVDFVRCMMEPHGGGHCWHVDMALMTNPPIFQERCCWCGDTRTQPPLFELPRAHGPHVDLHSGRTEP